MNADPGQEDHQIIVNPSFKSRIKKNFQIKIKKFVCLTLLTLHFIPPDPHHWFKHKIIKQYLFELPSLHFYYFYLNQFHGFIR